MTTPNKNFIEYNHNPQNQKVGDCVIRAIGTALNLSWEHVFEDLTRIAREQKNIPSGKEVYTEYLKPYQKIDVFYFKAGKRKRLTPNDVCNLEGSFIIRVAGHLTCVIDGKIYDLWDTGTRGAYVIWKVKG